MKISNQLTQPYYNGGTSADSESVVKQNNSVSPNETTVVESGNVFFLFCFVFVFLPFY